MSLPMLEASEQINSEPYVPQAGDVLFQALPEWMMVTAIEAITGSAYSHCGIVAPAVDAGGWVVLESWALAGQGGEISGGVIETPLEEWLARCDNGHFVAARFRGLDFLEASEVLSAAKRYMGRSYDIRFDLDNDEFYCSELIYRAYADATGAALVAPVAFGTLDWEPWALFIRAAEKGEIPIHRLVVTPQQLLESPLLETVYQHGEPPPIAELMGGVE